MRAEGVAMHSARSLSVLGLLVVAVVAAAVFLVPRDDAMQAGRALLYPALGDRVNDVATLSVRHANGEVVVEKRDGAWVLPSSHGYAADAGVVRRVLLDLAGARIVEPKTSKPALYRRLGVAQVSEPGSTARQVTLRDAAGDIVASVLIGDRAGGGDRYVRRDAEAQSLRVTAIGPVPLAAEDWLQSTIVDVERDEITDIFIEHGDERIELTAGAGGEMTLRHVPAGRRVAYQFALNDFASTLAGLELAAVRPDDDLDFGTGWSGRVVTRDGLEVRFETASADDATWFRFQALAADAATGEAANRAQRMNTGWDGWAYRLREADFDRLAKRRDDLLEDIPDADGAAGDEEASTVDESAASSGEVVPAPSPRADSNPE